ncbi:MAG: protein kinase [Gammaproteobacteria bacterium]|nr:protein kinase [Gammaproteobacteria bacterium]
MGHSDIPEEVVRYFERHPAEIKYSRKESQLSCSYMKEADGTIYSIEGKSNPDRLVGKGTFGVVKRIEDENEADDDAEHGVVKVQIIEDDAALEAAMKEAALNLKFGVAKGRLHVRRVEGRAYQYKVYQRMYDLGESLAKQIKKDAKKTGQTEDELQAQIRKEMQTSIDLCIEVARFNAAGFAHLDIKPDNVLVNAARRVRLCDFGTVTNQPTSPYTFDVGTPSHMPVDPHYGHDRLSIARGVWKLQAAVGGEGCEVTGMSNLVADRIGLLRSIDNSLHSGAILSQATRARLPKSVLDLLDTTTVAVHLSPERSCETPLLYAAMLISCVNKSFQMTEKEIEQLRQDPALQMRLLRAQGYDVVENTSTLSEFSGTAGETLSATETSVTDEEVSDEHVTVQAPVTFFNHLIPDDVIDYFKKHPDSMKYSRKDSQLPSSYIKEGDGTIYRVEGKSNPDRLVGKGTFGSVKRIEDEVDAEQGVVKVQIIADDAALAAAMKEAALNLQFGVAKGELHVRRIEGQSYQYKVYQRMHHLGESLAKHIRQDAKTIPQAADEKQTQITKEMKTAIALCLEVARFHAAGYAHRDIKPDNVLVDSAGKVHLCDFGTVTAELTGAYPFFDVGSPMYVPVDPSYACDIKSIMIGMYRLAQEVGGSDDGVNGVTNLFADRIGLLRCMDGPLQTGAILSQVTRSQLPQPILDLLNTNKVAAHLSLDRVEETPLFYAAVLISCLNNHYQMTEEDIQQLRQDSILQASVVAEHEESESEGESEGEGEVKNGSLDAL